MKSGAENRNKTIAAAALGVIALGCVVYVLVTELGGGPSTPPPAPVQQAAPAATPALKERSETVKSAEATAASQAAPGAPAGAGVIAGVSRDAVAKTNSSLDPTLDETAMLRTESLVYSGSGRNIFSLIYVPPAPTLPKDVPAVRHEQQAVVQAPTTPPPYVPPPIPLKFFGTVKSPNAPLQAFLLNGEDVYLAAQGDIVAHKYKINTIGTNNIQVEDLTNHNSQTLPLQLQ